MTEKLEMFVRKWNESIETYKLSSHSLKNPTELLMIDALSAVFDHMEMKPPLVDVSQICNSSLASLPLLTCLNTGNAVAAENKPLHIAVELFKLARYVTKNIGDDLKICLMDILQPTHKRCFKILMILHNYALFCKMTRTKYESEANNKIAEAKERKDKNAELNAAVTSIQIDVGRLKHSIDNVQKKIPLPSAVSELKTDRNEVEEDIEISSRKQKSLTDEKQELLTKIAQYKADIKSQEVLSAEMIILQRNYDIAEKKRTEAMAEKELVESEFNSVKSEMTLLIAKNKSIDELNFDIQKCFNDLKTYRALDIESKDISELKTRVTAKQTEITDMELKIINLKLEKTQLTRNINMELAAESLKLQSIKEKCQSFPENLDEKVGTVTRKICEYDNKIQVLEDNKEIIEKAVNEALDSTETMVRKLEEGLDYKTIVDY